MNFNIKIKFGSNFKRDKIETKLNKNNEYRDQIEYKTLTLTRGRLLGWHVTHGHWKKK